MTEISLILFDLNGVLYRYDRAVRIGALASVCGVGPDAIEAAIWDSGFEDSGDAGALTADAYLRGFAARLGHPLLGRALSEADWVAALRASISPIPVALALLARIRTGVTAGVLTNNNLLVLRHFQALYPAVAARVGKNACVSAEFGARKPDPDAYRGCLARLGVSPPATLFIDDSKANVAGAVAAGLAAHHTTGAEDLEAALQGFGLLA